MATVKILLDRNETEEEAQESLLKALTHQTSGEIHREEFHQPAARDVHHALLRAHEKMWAKVLKEIIEVIDSEVK